MHSEIQISVYGQTVGSIAPLLLLLTLPPVSVPTGLDSPDLNPVLNSSRSVSFLLCISQSLSPKTRTEALGCLVLCSLIDYTCVRKDAVLQPAPGASVWDG